MLRIQRLVVILAVIMMFHQASWAKFESDQLGKGSPTDVNLADKKAAPPKAEKTRQESARGSNAATTSAETEKNRKGLLDTLRAVDLLLKSNLGDEKRGDLSLRRAITLVSLARTYSIERRTFAEMTETERKYLESAKTSLNNVLARKQTSKMMMSQSYYLLGLIDFEFEKFSEQKEKFLKAYELAPKSPFAASLCLNIAEQNYEEEKYSEAIRYYQEKYEDFAPNQKTIADYKTAWSYVALSENQKAIGYFQKIILARQDKGFVKDSTRDMAYIATLFMSEDQVIALGQQNIKNSEQLGEFYYSAFKFFYNKNSADFKRILYAKAMEKLVQPESRLQMLLYALNSSRKEYPSKAPFLQLTEIQKEVKANRIPRSLVEENKDLEELNEFFVKVSAEALAGKRKMIEPIEREDLATLLVNHIKFHLNYFKKSKHLFALINIWTDVAIDQKKIVWLDEILSFTEKRSKEGDYPRIILNVKTQKLAFLEELLKKDPSYKGAFDKLADEFIKEYPEDKTTLLLYKRKSQDLFTQNQFEKALPIYQLIYQKESNEDNLYKYFFCLFKAEQYDKITSSPDLNKFKSARISDLSRESHLSLAKKADPSKDFAKYESSVLDFIKLTPDSKKQAAAYSDYLDKAYVTKGLDFYLAKFIALPAAIKSSPDLEADRLKAIGELLDRGDFKSVDPLIEPASNEGFQVAKFIREIPGNATWIKPMNDAFEKFAPTNKEYFSRLILISNPKLGRSQMLAHRKSSKEDQLLLLLSFQLEKGVSEPALTSAERKLMPLVSLSYLDNESVSPVEKELGSFSYPDPKWAEAKYNAAIEKLVARVQKKRKTILAEVKSLTPLQQSRVFKAAADVEMKTAESLKASPVPKELTPEQVAEYNKGLADIAKEFVDQSAEFQKLEAALSEKINKASAERSKEALPALDLTKVSLPDTPVKAKWQELLKNSSLTEAMIYLDRNFQSKKISAEAYYLYRGYGLLLAYKNSEFIRSYVKQEWVAANQGALIQKWAPPATSQQ